MGRYHREKFCLQPIIVSFCNNCVSTMSLQLKIQQFYNIKNNCCSGTILEGFVVVKHCTFGKFTLNSDVSTTVVN